MTEFPYPEEIRTAVDASLPRIHQHLLDGLPEEVVGLVLSDGTTIRLINQARSSAKFEVGVTQLSRVMADIDPSVHTVIAVYHSHPKGSLDLSPHDQTNMRAQWLNGLSLPWIVMTENYQASFWWLDPSYRQLTRILLTPEMAVA